MTDPIQMTVLRENARALTLDVYQGAGAGPRPCVILLHGGAWMFGDRSQMAPYATTLAADGFTAIAAEYRLVGEAQWPAQIQDVKDVIAFVRANAGALGIDPAMIALQGFSAGGHLALLAALTASHAANGEMQPKGSTRIAAVIGCFAPTALQLPPPEAGPNPIAALLGSDASEATCAAASPLSHVSQDAPPTFLIHGTRDHLIPYASSVALFDALDRAGVDVELHLVQGQTHEFTLLPSLLAPIEAEVGLFLRRVMVDPAFYARENADLNPFAGGGVPGRPERAA